MGESSAVEIGQKYSTSVSPLLTIAYQRSFKRHLNKYFFYPQVRFFRYQSGAESRNVNIRTTIDFSSSLVVLPELNVGVNLLNKEHLSHNISAGVGVMNILKNHHVRKRYSEGVQEPYFITETNLSKATIAMNISTGLVLSKKLVLVASYLLPTTTGKNVYFFIKSSGVQLRMGYLL